MWPTRTPPSAASPTRQVTKLAVPTPEPAAPQSSDSDTMTDAEGVQKGEKARKGQREEGEKEGEEEKDEKEDDDKTKKDKTAAVEGGTLVNSTVAGQHTTTGTASTARERTGESVIKETKTEFTAAPSNVLEDNLLTNTKSSMMDIQEPDTWETENDTLKMQLPNSVTLRTKTESEERNRWPFSIHTGEGTQQPIPHSSDRV